MITLWQRYDQEHLVISVWLHHHVVSASISFTLFWFFCFKAFFLLFLIFNFFFNMKVCLPVVACELKITTEKYLTTAKPHRWVTWALEGDTELILWIYIHSRSACRSVWFHNPASCLQILPSDTTNAVHLKCYIKNVKLSFFFFWCHKTIFTLFVVWIKEWRLTCFLCSNFSLNTVFFC